MKSEEFNQNDRISMVDARRIIEIVTDWKGVDMTENNASVRLEVIRAGLLSGTDAKIVSSEENIKTITVIINALEEIQQYRKHGITIKSAMNNMRDLTAAENLLGEYRTIGTLEECRTAVEKQTAKKGIREKIKKGYNRGMHHYYCPVCYEKGDLRNKYNVGLYCSDCGQKLDWEDEK